MRPSGRSSRAVYWRRRIVLLLVLALLVVGSARVLRGGAHSADAAAPAGATTAAAARPTATPSTPAPSPKQRKARVAHVSVRLPVAASSCDPTNLEVAPSVSTGAYAAGIVTLRLAVSSTATSPCTAELSSRLVLAVADEDGTLWDSRCTPVPTRKVEVQPTWSSTFDVPWSGRRSGKDCDTPGSFLLPGTYRVQAAMLGGEPAEATFTLRQRPAPKPNPIQKPAPAKATAKPTAEATAKR